MRVCIYTKMLTQRLDEGMVRVAYEIVRQLSKHHEVLTLFSTGDAPEKEGLIRIPTNRSVFNLRLRAEIRRFRPDVILFIPRAPASLSSLLLARVLRWYGGSADLTMLTPQANGFTSLSRKCVPLLKPDLVLATSRKDQRELVALGCVAQFVPLGVDIERFTPVTPSRKRELRRRYGIGEEDTIALHVGHIREGRNLRALERIQDSGNQVLIVGSTFFPHEANLVDDLEAHRIRFLTGYLDHIEEIYQLADWYVFPTLSEKACISQPLSVLEAMACNLPVVSTRFGGLPDLFPSEGGGLFYCDSNSELAAKFESVREGFRHASPRTRELAEQFSWDRSCRKILRFVEGSHSPPVPATRAGDNA